MVPLAQRRVLSQKVAVGVQTGQRQVEAKAQAFEAHPVAHGAGVQHAGKAQSPAESVGLFAFGCLADVGDCLQAFAQQGGVFGVLFEMGQHRFEDVDESTARFPGAHFGLDFVGEVFVHAAEGQQRNEDRFVFLFGQQGVQRVVVLFGEAVQGANKVFL